MPSVLQFTGNHITTYTYIGVRCCDSEETGMATKLGKKMTRTGGWTLKPKKGRERKFSGTLLKTFNFGNKRLAIFSVPKRFD